MSCSIINNTLLIESPQLQNGFLYVEIEPEFVFYEKNAYSIQDKFETELFKVYFGLNEMFIYLVQQRQGIMCKLNHHVHSYFLSFTKKQIQTD
jgi:hypothetical protein